jgi:Lipid A 3-O-deacylase (PagL)
MPGKRGHHLLFLSLLFVSLHLAGQVTEEHDPPARDFIEIVGAATLADGSLQGTTVDRRLFVFGAAYSRVLSRHRIVEVRFTAEVIPMALLREPFSMFVPIQSLSSNQFTVMRETYGFGASPVGIELDWLPRKKIQPFFGIEGGFLRFDRNVPDFLASKFNFTIDGRGGVRIALPHERSISVAYAFEHMSNAYTAHDNPGLDAHMISVTYRIPLRSFRSAR